MAKTRSMLIGFPLGGLDRKVSYRQDKPFATPDCLNVRPVGTIESRKRGGSRPALTLSHDTDVGAAYRLLYPMTLSLSGGAVTWSDAFEGSSLSGKWSASAGGESLPEILTRGGVGLKAPEAGYRHAVLDALSVDTDETYYLEAYIEPIDGEWAEIYLIHSLMDDATPDVGEDGWAVVLRTDVTPGNTQRIELWRYSGGSKYTFNWDTMASWDGTRGGWLKAKISPQAAPDQDKRQVEVWWQGVQQEHSGDGSTVAYFNFTPAGARAGLGIGWTGDAPHPEAGIRVFRVQGVAETGAPVLSQSVLVASAGGNLYLEEIFGSLAVVTSDLTVRSDVSLTAAQNGQKLFVADYGNVRATGTDGVVSGVTLDSVTYPDWTTLGILTDDDVCVISSPSGSAGTFEISSVAAGAVTLASSPGDNSNCSFRIERAPKVYDPATGTLSLLVATAGQVPTGCPIAWRHLGRLMFAGAEIAPHVWYGSRQFDEQDWDYAQTDSQRAVAGTSADAGVPGSAITAGFACGDDYSIIACRNEIWRMRGDPAYGGSLIALSQAIGIIDKHAWCITPPGELVFLSADGVYVLPPGGEGKPQSVSREKLPQELLNVDPNVFEVSLEYSIKDRGIHIHLTPESDQGQTHWWLDWQDKTFWPDTLTGDHEPTATCALQSTATENSGVILGGRDGTLRRYDPEAENDTGTAFSSYIDIGPIPMAADGAVGTLVSLDGIIAEDSGNVTWSVHPASTFEAATSASSSDSGTWVAGLNARVHPAARGQAYMLKITGTAGGKWVMEHVVAAVRDSGPRRVA